MFNEKLLTITARIIEEGSDFLSPDTISELFASPAVDSRDLILCAGKIREHHKEDRVFTCSIVNAKSGFCPENCAFCPQSVHHKTDIPTYPLMDLDDLVGHAVRLHDAGATKYSMVTSGYMLDTEEIDRICQAAAIIRGKTSLAVCASLGMLTQPMAKKLVESGITTFHHNLETSRSFFSEICTTHDYDEDLQTIAHVKAAGMKICSGGILGMGETWEQRVELALTLKELDVDRIPLNFLNPIPGTRLEKRPFLPPMEALRCVSLFRFVNPAKDITICGGREVTLRDYQSWLFAAGANGLMIGNYLTTQGRNADMDVQMIKDSGLQIYGQDA